MKLLLAIVAALAGFALLQRLASLQSGGAASTAPGAFGAPQTDGPGSSLADYSPSTASEMAQAIYQFEGGQPGNVNFDNMNPGNLRSAPGETGTNRGYATFGSFTDGFAALQNYITQHAAAHPGWNFYDFFNYYLRGSTTAPSSDAQGNSDTYAQYVANYLGVPATAAVSSVLG